MISIFGLSTEVSLILIACLLLACAFEFINGFHDTANAVATVIYTNSLPPVVAVVWSGFMNFLGVILGGTAVAMGIIKLLPPGVLAGQSDLQNLALVVALLLTAIVWNLGTWYLGLPCSSSHTLIGSILGVGLGYNIVEGASISAGVNWDKAEEIGLSLLISPFIGFMLTLLLVRLVKTFAYRPLLFRPADRTRQPPWYIRTILILTCTGVSFSHGSNDGQKGVGLVMLILVALAPVHFSLNADISPDQLRQALVRIHTYLDQAPEAALTEAEAQKREAALGALHRVDSVLGQPVGQEWTRLSAEALKNLRADLNGIHTFCQKVLIESNKAPQTQHAQIRDALNPLKKAFDYAPSWVVIMISISLGVGTMIGWKRIVKTIGERIGKEHLSYVQGASAEVTAAATIQLASATGLPVSTTQVLSSGVAGSMVGTGGAKNLQSGTVRNILIAWLLTFPVTMFLSALLFVVLRLWWS